MAILNNPKFEENQIIFLINLIAPNAPISMCKNIIDALVEHSNNPNIERERFYSAWFAVSNEVLDNIPDPIAEWERRNEHDLEGLI
tara:strand:+ start:2072 stop:2329 length:258 start_codon:yes stop_codon:yes gene_type:complete